MNPHQKSTTTREWDPNVPIRHRAFECLEAFWTFRDHGEWPGVTALQACIDQAGSSDRFAVRMPRVVESDARSAERYERAVFERRELGVTLRAWHDVFNVLVWSAFPASKAALNARHVRELERPRQGVLRTRVRDALTTFDEDGVIIASTDPTLLDAIREFRWQYVFLERRTAWHRQLHIVVFGHAMLEKLLDPFVGLTGKAVLFEVEEKFAYLSPQSRIAHLDRKLSAVIESETSFAAPQVLSPVPVLGTPGWWSKNESPAFYSDTHYFRPGRRVRTDDNTQ